MLDLCYLGKPQLSSTSLNRHLPRHNFSEEHLILIITSENIPSVGYGVCLEIYHF